MKNRKEKEIKTEAREQAREIQVTSPRIYYPGASSPSEDKPLETSNDATNHPNILAQSQSSKSSCRQRVRSM
jgi:hypothetical protein